ncbi:MAG: 8-oxo-dGTP pyrophosphatase MutT (NUDIX family) [Candidatus Aldehydirespiratoraceae bacterium]|jgi:8-oxo-dGTP pyrophosphatase MutT (NUDIX family)
MPSHEGRWVEHSQRFVYESDWMSMALVDVETPSGKRFEHHAVRFPQPAVGVVVVVDEHVLMIWRHRFITDTWGWEIPAGGVDPGESIADAAHRECVEETGWAPGPTRPVMAWHPSNGATDQKFHIERAASATQVGPPTDTDEAVKIEWMPLADVRPLVHAGQIGDGLSAMGLLSELASI